MAHRLTTIAGACRRALATFARDVAHGMLEVSHNSLAMLGLAVVAGLLVFSTARPDLRAGAEQHMLDWLLARQEARDTEQGVMPRDVTAVDAVSRATAADPATLPRQQAKIATWLARRYRVAPEPISRLVQEAWSVGQRVGLDPTLILAVMAVESSFNPFAQSPVGAQGLMQVMTHVHDDKYEPYGGVRAAFDPVTNLRVGVQVLKECITRAGGLEAGLRYYVGAANLADDGGYAAKVMAEQQHLRRVAEGKLVAVTATLPVTWAPAAAASATSRETTIPLPKPGPDAPAADNSDDDHVALLR
jgi:Transglycosylase SLT domain